MLKFVRCLVKTRNSFLSGQKSKRKLIANHRQLTQVIFQAEPSARIGKIGCKTHWNLIICRNYRKNGFSCSAESTKKRRFKRWSIKNLLRYFKLLMMINEYTIATCIWMAYFINCLRVSTDSAKRDSLTVPGFPWPKWSKFSKFSH